MNLYQIRYKQGGSKEQWATTIRFEREHVAFYTDKVITLAIRSEDVDQIELL